MTLKPITVSCAVGLEGVGHCRQTIMISDRYPNPQALRELPAKASKLLLGIIRAAEAGAERPVRVAVQAAGLKPMEIVGAMARLAEDGLIAIRFDTDADRERWVRFMADTPKDRRNGEGSGV